MTRKRPSVPSPAPQAEVATGDWRVRYAIFRGKSGLYHPSGSDRGNRRRGYPSAPPPTFQPPVEMVRTAATLKLARDIARELRQTHGPDVVAIHIEKIELTPAPARPRQLSLADIGDDWQRLPPRREWMGE
jgi:hypothetical protein